MLNLQNLSIIYRGLYKTNKTNSNYNNKLSFSPCQLYPKYLYKFSYLTFTINHWWGVNTYSPRDERTKGKLSNMPMFTQLVREI